jgi:hypothetical protein
VRRFIAALIVSGDRNFVPELVEACWEPGFESGDESPHSK